MRDDLGTRMKEQYENRAQVLLPRRSFTIIRIDGKAFHTYTRGFRPAHEDRTIAYAMDEAAHSVVEEAQGAKLAFVQSDEISIVLTDFDRIETAAWFDGNLQKIVSVAASLATMGFNRALDTKPTATFDARAFVIPDAVEVENYFIWRQKDAIRNAIQSLAQSHFSQKQLHGKKRADLLAMLVDKGVHFETLPIDVQRGSTVVREVGARWTTDPEIPIFTEDREYLRRQWRVGDVATVVPPEPEAERLTA